MKKLKYLLLLLCFSFFIVGCNKQQEAVEKSSTSTPLLFEVTKEGSENKLYLFGSIHAAKESIYPLPEYVTNAYQESEVLAVELDLIEYAKDFSSQVEDLSKFIIPEEKEIQDYIEEEDYNKLVEILKDAGLYSPLYARYNPMYWLMLVENAAIVEAELNQLYGIDNHFLTLAKDEDNKEILELESAEYQYDILSGFEVETQIQLLKQEIEEYEEAKTAMKELYELYTKGEQEELEKLLLETDKELEPYEEEYNNKLVTVRNQNMAESLEIAFKEGKNIFCTVGLAHIIGEGGIVDLLEQQGYTVKIVK